MSSYKKYFLLNPYNLHKSNLKMQICKHLAPFQTTILRIRKLAAQGLARRLSEIKLRCLKIGGSHPSICWMHSNVQLAYWLQESNALRWHNSGFIKGQNKVTLVSDFCIRFVGFPCTIRFKRDSTYLNLKNTVAAENALCIWNNQEVKLWMLIHQRLGYGTPSPLVYPYEDRETLH